LDETKSFPVRGDLVGTAEAQELAVQYAWASVEVGIRGLEGLSRKETRVGVACLKTVQHTPTENSPARARARQRKIQSMQSVDRGQRIR
jgi:hypothetical protein